MNIREYLVGGILACALALSFGCTSVEPVPPTTGGIRLDEPQTRRFDNPIWSVTFPAGEYKPSFQTARGIYYDAPGAVIISGKSPERGGLFIPFDNGKQACWLDATGKHRYNFSVPVTYR